MVVGPSGGEADRFIGGRSTGPVARLPQMLVHLGPVLQATPLRSRRKGAGRRNLAAALEEEDATAAKLPETETKGHGTEMVRLALESIELEKDGTAQQAKGIRPEFPKWVKPGSAVKLPTASPASTGGFTAGGADAPEPAEEPAPSPSPKVAKYGIKDALASGALRGDDGHKSLKAVRALAAFTPAHKDGADAEAEPDGPDSPGGGRESQIGWLQEEKKRLQQEREKATSIHRQDVAFLEQKIGVWKGQCRDKEIYLAARQQAVEDNTAYQRIIGKRTIIAQERSNVHSAEIARLYAEEKSHMEFLGNLEDRTDKVQENLHRVNRKTDALRAERVQADEGKAASEERLQQLEQTLHQLRVKRASQVAEEVEHAKQEEHETIGEDTMDQIEAAYSEIALLRNQLARLLGGTSEHRAELARLEEEADALRRLSAAADARMPAWRETQALVRKVPRLLRAALKRPSMKSKGVAKRKRATKLLWTVASRSSLREFEALYQEFRPLRGVCREIFAQRRGGRKGAVRLARKRSKLAKHVTETTTGGRRIAVEKSVQEDEMAHYINTLQARVLNLKNISADIGSHSPHLATLHNFFATAGQELLDDISRDDVALKQLDGFILKLQKLEIRKFNSSQTKLMGDMKAFFMDWCRRKRAEVSSKAASGRLGIAKAQEVRRSRGKDWIDIDAVVPEGQVLSRQQVERLMEIHYEQRVEQNKVFDVGTMSDPDATRSTREVWSGHRNLVFCTAKFTVTLIGKKDLHVRTILDDMPEIPLDKYISLDEIKFDEEAWCARVLTPFRDPGDVLNPYRVLHKKRTRVETRPTLHENTMLKDVVPTSGDASARRQDELWQQLGKTVAEMVHVHFKQGSPFTQIPLQHGSFDIKHSDTAPAGIDNDFTLVFQEFLDGSDPETRHAVVRPDMTSPFYEESSKLDTFADLKGGPGVEKVLTQLVSALVYRTSKPIFGIDWLVVEYNVIGGAAADFSRYVGVRVRDVNLQCGEPFDELLSEHREGVRRESNEKSTLTLFLAQLMRTCDWSALDIHVPYTTFGPCDPNERVAIAGAAKPARSGSSSAPSKATVPLSFLVYADGSAVCTSSTFAAANTSGLRARRSVMTDAHDLHVQELQQRESDKLKNRNTAKARWHRAYQFAIVRARINALKNLNKSLRAEVEMEMAVEAQQGDLMKKLEETAKEDVANEDWSKIQEATRGYGLAVGPSDINWNAQGAQEYMTYEATLDGFHNKMLEQKRKTHDSLSVPDDPTPKKGPPSKK